MPFDDVDPPNGAIGMPTPLTQKGAIGPCEGNVGLSRNLVVVLLCNGRAASQAV